MAETETVAATVAETVAETLADTLAAPAAVADYIRAQEGKDQLRFLTCGSVDDGKSTLIGRLLYDTKLIFEDQLAALEKESRRHGTVGDDIDLALLVDGLEAEREQGITIDVAYRFFATDKRKFIVADTPGHEQYTRNMATGASTADLAVLLVDARHGLMVQTRRHAFIASLLGIRHVVLAVNKIDLVGFDRARFEAIEADFRSFAAGFDFESLVAIPLSARYGDNVTARSEAMAWYGGPTLLEHLETVDVGSDAGERPFRLPVQWVNRPNLDFRGFSGTIAGGRIAVGDPLVVAGSGKGSTVARILTPAGEARAAGAGQAVTVTLADEIDISRGDVLCAPEARPDVADQMAAHVIWMAEEALLPGRSYLMKIGTKTVTATVTEIKHKINVTSFEHVAAKTLGLNEIAFCNLGLAAPVAFDPYEANRTTGAFILIDRLTNATVGAGMVWFALRRASNIHWQALDVDRQARAEALGQKPAVLWFTGLSGSGKSTVASIVEKKLHAEGRHTYTLDGDNIRHGLNRDLGFTDADRVENIRRVAEVARLFADAGLITLVSFISPFRSERQMARALLPDGAFVEIFVDTPIAECRRRDPKGLYAKADRGEIANFTGIDSPYEPPEAAELVLNTVGRDPEAVADDVIAYLKAQTIIA
ncbi:sulfate adenylyltransferase subunit CysN [Polymorphum gilvum]|uniref:Multifunctional fusion protein n=1 Tax=Polymorphum gilvum (strain LMG 25793 / CGMCC 1.9160 / SL003B-26A1) TaxID=991905 RepID=F2IW83_POLGS|nr:sulfate adenylyltransferase subunit CysN [Polymorphum gilvum]ADZ71131.1 Bifunctional sulfate adenylyltransferase subunit 1/adenylylsulfate kinase protein [Polymorphum gilvum SL003B-26A1]ADZ71468.1 Bifunctional sulfate adenylyltransferase subunit 1/adenylylsulfate kinase protein [Polymorphum gilvum SL003B-26A1]